MKPILMTTSLDKHVQAGPGLSPAASAHLLRALNALVIFAVLLIGIFPAAAYGVVSGDFRSAVAGPADWATAGAWQTYNGTTGWEAATEYPGQSAGTYAVEIQSEHEIQAGVDLTTLAMGTVTVTGKLSIAGATAFYLNTSCLQVPSGGTIYFGEYANNHTVLSLPAGATITVTTGGLSTFQCDANKYIKIGGAILSSCSGGGAGGYSFADLMAAGGNLYAFSVTALANGQGPLTVCAGESIALTATPDGLYGSPV